MSGSRLRANLVVDGTGARVFEGWHDTMLDVDCTFGPDSEGVLRCTPGFYPAFIAYSDAACTVPIVEVPSCATPPTYVAELRGACRPRLVRQVGARVSNRPAMLYGMTAGACSPAGAPNDSDDLYTASEPIPSSMLVRGVLRREARGTALAVDVVDGEDGSRDAHGVLDVMRGFHCQAFDNVLAKGRCVPLGLAYSRQDKHDDACSEPVVFYPRLSREPFCEELPGAIQRIGPLQEDPIYDVIGTEALGPVYRTIGGMCMVQTSLPPGARFFFPGTGSFATSTLTPVSVVHEGTSRVSTEAFTAASGERLYARRFFDATRNQVCVPGVTSDGVLRCIPPNTFIGAYYSDAACTRPAVPVVAGASPPGYITLEESLSRCEARSRIFDVTTPLPPATPLFLGDALGCNASPAVDGVTYYDTTEALPAASFPPLSRIRE